MGSLKTLALLAALIVSPTLSAEEAPPADQADALRRQAQHIREEADRQQAIDNRACYGKILVNACLEDTRVRRVEAMTRARTLEEQARGVEREERNRERAARQTKQAEESARRDAEIEARSRRYREDEAEKARQRAEHQAEKERQADAGRARRAAEDAERQRRRAAKQPKGE